MSADKTLLPIVPTVIREHPNSPLERWEEINCCCCCSCYVNGNATSFPLASVESFTWNELDSISWWMVNEHLRTRKTSKPTHETKAKEAAIVNVLTNVYRRLSLPCRYKHEQWLSRQIPPTIIARVWERKIIESNKFSLICSFSSYLASQSKAQDWERWLETSWIFVAISTSLDTSHHDRWRDKTSADKWVFSRWIHPSIQTNIYMAPLNANTLKPSIGNDDVSVWKYIKQLTFLISLCIAFPPSPILIMVLDCVYDSLSIEWGVRTQGVGIDCLRTCLSSNQRSSKEKKDWSRWYSCLLLRKMKRQGATPLCAQ